MAGYPPRRCATCRSRIYFENIESEKGWSHVNPVQNDHEIVPLKVSEMTENEKRPVDRFGETIPVIDYDDGFDIGW